MKHFDFFLSYASSDSDLAAEVQGKINGCGLSCFMAKKNLSSGEAWSEEIREALIGSDRIALLLTSESVKRPWVNMEIGACWALKRRIVPIRSAGITDEQWDALPDPVKQFHAAEYGTDAGRQKFFDQLKARAVEAHAARTRVFEEIEHQKHGATAAGSQLRFNESSVLVLRKSVQSLQSYCDDLRERLIDRLVKLSAELMSFPALQLVCSAAEAAVRQIQEIEYKLELRDRSFRSNQQKEALKSDVKSCCEIVERVVSDLKKLLDLLSQPAHNAL